MEPMRNLLRLAPLALVAALVGCGGAEENNPVPADDDLLAPPAEGKGVQFRMTTELAPGVEGEHCQFVQAPAEGMYLNRDEVRYSKGSHHFLLYETSYDEIPTAKEDGTPVDTSGVFDCTDGGTNGWSVTKLIGGSQNADGASLLKFPSDVAMYVRPGAVLLMNAHYINASGETMKPQVAINLHTIPREQVKQEGDLFFLYNIFIKIDPQSTSRAHMRCPVYSDITLSNVQSHMHARGVGYEARSSSGEAFYVNDKWEGVPVKDFEGGLQIKAGDVLDYYCDYNNPEERTVFQGPRSTDEMCMLVGSYYPADPATTACAGDPENPQMTGNIGADWVGNGTATCAASMGCVQSAFSQSDFQSLTTCVLDADPAVSAEMSDFLRCMFLLQSGEEPMVACQAEISACAAK